MIGAAGGYLYNMLKGIAPQGTASVSNKYTGALFPAINVKPLAAGDQAIIKAVLKAQPNATAYTIVQYPGSLSLPSVVGPMNFSWESGTNLSALLRSYELESGYGGR